jgi:hypothetical protein
MAFGVELADFCGFLSGFYFVGKMWCESGMIKK